MFYNNIFLSDDIGDLGIIDYTHNTHSDFFLEFLEVIFIAAWHYRKFNPESERRKFQNALNLPKIDQLAHMPLFLYVFWHRKAVSDHDLEYHLRNFLELNAKMS